MNRKEFFRVLRAGLGSFTTAQVSGIEALLDNAPARINLEYQAYCLATAWHETARTMQPIHELGARSYFDKYEPGTTIGRALGNTVRGDGYRFRGRGYVQLTGRRNYAFASERVGVDLVTSPERALEPAVAARILYVGMMEGWFTGKKLSDASDGVDESDAEDLREFIADRKIVNGTDKAQAIADFALDFEHALRAGAKATELESPPAPAPEPPPAATEAPQDGAGPPPPEDWGANSGKTPEGAPVGLWARLWRWLAG